MGSKRKWGKKNRSSLEKPKRPIADYTDIEYKNEAYEVYYKRQLPQITNEEWDFFMNIMKQTLPATMKVNSSSPLWRCIRGLLQHWSSTSSSGGLRPLKFVSNDLAWQWNELDRIAIRKSEELKFLKNFSIQEVQRGGLSRLETVSMIPAVLLNIDKKDSVLDLCAAPGSKTCMLLDALGSELSDDLISHKVNEEDFSTFFADSSCWAEVPFRVRKQLGSSIPEGMVVANDVSFTRAHMLCHHVQQLNSPSIVITCIDASFFPSATQVTQHGSSQFLYDKVLADVPCTCDGTLRKAADIWKNWKMSDGISIHQKQVTILVRGLQHLKVGGTLVYSTCSLNPIENEAVVGAILAKYGESVRLEAAEIPDFKTSPGLTKWVVPVRRPSKDSEDSIVYADSFAGNEDLTHIRRTMFPPEEEKVSRSSSSSSLSLPSELEKCVRVLPHHNDTGGFFAAILRKTDVLNTSDQELGGDKNIKRRSPTNITARGSCVLWSHLDPGSSNWVEISEFFGIDIGAFNLVYKSDNANRLMLVSENVLRHITEYEYKSCDLKYIHIGTRVFEAVSKKNTIQNNNNNSESNISSSYGHKLLKCNWRLVQGGVHYLVKFMKRRVLFCNIKFAREFLKHRKLSFTQLSQFSNDNCIWGLRSLCHYNDESSAKVSSKNAVEIHEILAGSCVVVIVPRKVTSSTEKNHDDSPLYYDANHIDSVVCTSPSFATLKDSLCISAMLSIAGTLEAYVNNADVEAISHYLFSYNVTENMANSSTTHIITDQ